MQPLQCTQAITHQQVQNSHLLMSFTKNFKNHKNKNHRDYTASAIIGDKRQGKSTLIKLLIDDYIAKYPNRRVLVYDISKAFGKDSHGFEGYPLMTLDELYNGKIVNGRRARWKKGVRRVTGIDYDGVLSYMVDVFRDGLLIIDEATTVMSDNPSDKRKAIMITHTNQRVDLFMVFHGLGYVPKRLRGNFWNYYFFKTPDQVSVKQLEAMKFPNPKRFHEQWEKSQKAPHKEDQIMQYFTCFSRTFQQK